VPLSVVGPSALPFGLPVVGCNRAHGRSLAIGPHGRPMMNWCLQRRPYLRARTQWLVRLW